METIFLNIEKLKKEVWAISKKKIPTLEAQIEGLGGVDVSELTATLQTQQTALNNLSSSLDSLSASQSESQTKITALESKAETHDADIETLKSSLKSTNKTLDELSDLVASHTTSINSLNTTMADNTSAISTNASNISANASAITSLQGTVSEQATSLSTLQSQVDTLSSNVSSNTSSLVSVTESLNALTTRVNNLETGATNLSNSITTINGQISTIQSNAETTTATANQALTLAQSVKETVDNLDTSGGTGGGTQAPCLNGVLIYDMRSTDESINCGYTTGLQYHNKVMVDLTPYRYLKIFTVFSNSYENQMLIDIKNKKGFLFTSVSWVTSTGLDFIRVRVPSTLNFVMLETYGEVLLDSIDLSLTIADPDKRASFIISRIEGIV